MTVLPLRGFSSSSADRLGHDEKDAYENKVSEYFLHEREKFDARLSSEDLFLPFRWLAQPLKDFLIIEKQRLCRVDEKRVAVDHEQNPLTGYSHWYDIKDDRYDPSCMEPFPIKGYWVPKSEGDLFMSRDEDAYPFLRKTALGVYCLFLVHPRSEALFAPLMDKFKHTEQVFMALALSSVRTLIVAMPSEGSSYTYQMVKVSLQDSLGGAVRVLHKKECGSSVRLSALFAKRPPLISFCPEDVSFVPDISLMSEGFDVSRAKGAGTIFRTLPSELSCRESDGFIIPLYSLLGSSNVSFLSLFISQSRLTPEDFIEHKILRPLAKIMLHQICVQHVSLEIHAQNLLVKVSPSSDDVRIDFLYRDLGGVNLVMQPSDREHLPIHLLSDEFSWEQNYVKDAADVVEAFSFKVLFSFTKLFFNTEDLCSQSPRFNHWREEMQARDFGVNWIVTDGKDRHIDKVPLEKFCRYGYFEKRFGQFLVAEAYTLDCFAKDQEDKAHQRLQELLCRLQEPNTPFTQCHEIEWFHHFISSLLQ
jgi:hypothetical protein